MLHPELLCGFVLLRKPGPTSFIFSNSASFKTIVNVSIDREGKHPEIPNRGTAPYRQKSLRDLGTIGDYCSAFWVKPRSGQAAARLRH